MQETVHSPHQIDFLVRWLKERIRRDEEAEWGSPCLGGVCLLSANVGCGAIERKPTANVASQCKATPPKRAHYAD